MSTPLSYSYSEDDYHEKRTLMVANQLQKRDIHDAHVLRAMMLVPRHKFIGEDEKPFAYGDYPLPIGLGQTISQPYIVALMSQLLNVSEGDKILEVGTGSGYQTAILYEMGCRVYTIEIVEALAGRTDRLLDELGYRTILRKAGDGYRGWPEHAPFDRIIITAAVPEIPAPLIEQLVLGGRLVLPVNVSGGHQMLQVITKTETGIKKQDIAPVRFVPLVREKK